MLALAAATFGAPSETFIHDHARHLAPDATVLICRDEQGTERFGFPVFLGKGAPDNAQDFASLCIRAFKLRWTRYCDPIRAYLDNALYAPYSRDETARLCSFLERYRPVALLAEYGPVGLQVAEASARADVPLYVHFHGWDANILGESWSIRRDYRALFKAAKGIIATTDFLKGRLLALGCPEDKLAVCPCGVDIDLFRPGSRATNGHVLMASRLVPQKGPDYSLASFARMSTGHPEVMLEIIGEGPLRGRLEEQAAEFGIAQRVIFHGARDHDFVRQRMSGATLFIKHSVSIPGNGVESQGLSILEAMACAVPVVATRHGAIGEIVEDGVTGSLVDERDVAAMAGAMSDLVENPDEASRIGAAGRRRVMARYSQNDAIDRLRRILGLSGPVGVIDAGVTR